MRRTLLFALLLAATAHAQWDLQNSSSTADLRGIHFVGKGIAWASGSNGTVLRTEEGGHLWQRCTVPPGADKLDFRGVQAFDAKTAIVMSSGKGDLSRLYKTTDGCQTWKLIFTNPDKDGFWDALNFLNPKFGVLLGDPVNGIFAVFLTFDGGLTWAHDSRPALADLKGEGGFAASNSILLVPAIGKRIFCTGGIAGPRIFQFASGPGIDDTLGPTVTTDPKTGWQTVLRADRLSATQPSSESAGCFSMATSPDRTTVAVGGDYQNPSNRTATAWTSSWSSRSRGEWSPTQTPPHGYRSAVAYDTSTKTWITVGPNGTDISTDDGRNWHALKPAPTDAPDADQHWNALSLPFVVGPHGSIGVINPAALKPTK